MSISPINTPSYVVLHPLDAPCQKTAWWPGNNCWINLYSWCPIINTLRPRQNGCHFPDDIFKCIFLDENVLISIVPKGPINNIPVLAQIMAWRQPGDKPLSEPMVVSLLTYTHHSASVSWIKSSQCNSFEVWLPADFIYMCLIFHWVAETSPHDRVPG